MGQKEFEGLQKTQNTASKERSELRVLRKTGLQGRMGNSMGSSR